MSALILLILIIFFKLVVVVEHKKARKPKTKPPFRVPAWLQITGLLCGLLLCSTVIIYTLRAMIPTFDGKIQAAHRILAEPDPSILDLRNATDDLEKLLQRYPQDPMAVEALGLVDELQTRRLLRLAEGGRVGNREGAIRDSTYVPFGVKKSACYAHETGYA